MTPTEQKELLQRDDEIAKLVILYEDTAAKVGRLTKQRDATVRQNETLLRLNERMDQEAADMQQKIERINQGAMTHHEDALAILAWSSTGNNQERTERVAAALAEKDSEIERLTAELEARKNK